MAAVLTAIPRPKGRGLIEACADPNLQQVPRESIPRPKGRGLIEAGSTLRSSYPSPRFRGRKVAASLKRLHRRGGRGGRLAIPRPKGRGLIEACPCAASGATVRARIPRPKGRGLIEATDQESGQLRGRGFRGRKVAASLKRGRGRRGPGRDRGIPRPKGRGLIEAGPIRTVRRAAWRDSAAERSRPH